MSVTVYFEELLAKVFTIISRTDLKGKGMRIIEFSGDVLEFATEESIRLMKEALPVNTYILRPLDREQLLQPSLFQVDGSVKDRYALLLCNTEWPKIKEGGFIPKLQVWYGREGNRPDGKLKCQIVSEDIAPTSWELKDRGSCVLEMAGARLTLSSLKIIAAMIARIEAPLVDLYIRGIDPEGSPTLMRDIALVEAACTGEEYDGTDAAHPAWWRGHEQTTAILCQKINEILGGKDKGEGANHEPWGTVRRRLIKLVEQNAFNWSRVLQFEIRKLSPSPGDILVVQTDEALRALLELTPEEIPDGVVITLAPGGAEIAKEDYSRGKLTALVDEILRPGASSKTVVGMAKEIRDELGKK